MSSFKYARLLDTNLDEQTRGMTIEYNQIDFDYDGNLFRLIDTPGHNLYVPQLISAIYENIDGFGLIGVLVVSCLQKELEVGLSKGQIKEDIYLMRAAGINSIIVCINKMDKVNYNAENFQLACQKIGKILTDAKFKQIQYVPTSGWTGQGLITPCPLQPESQTPIQSLMATVQSMNVNLIQKSEIDVKVRKGYIFIVNVFILECQSIFSPGYQAVLHTRSGQIGFTVVKIKGNKFLRRGERGVIKINLDSEQSFEKSERIIMRNANCTIGYGIIIS